MIAIVFVLISYVAGVVNMLTSQVIALVALAIGAWAGYKSVEFKGNYADIIVAGIIGILSGTARIRNKNPSTHRGHDL